MSITDPDNEKLGMTEYEYERPMMSLEERKVTREIRLIAYLLWFFLGWLMVHRMYLGTLNSLAFCIMMFFVGSVIFVVNVSPPFFPMPLELLVGLFWLIYLGNWIVELFRIPKMSRNKIQMSLNKIQQGNKPELTADGLIIKVKESSGSQGESTAAPQQTGSRRTGFQLAGIGVVVGIMGLVLIVSMGPPQDSCDDLKVKILDMLNERGEKEPAWEVLKIYKDVEDLTEKLTKELTKEQESNFRWMFLSVDKDAEILRLCKGRVKFAKGAARDIAFYSYRDVDGDEFIGYRPVPSVLSRK